MIFSYALILLLHSRIYKIRTRKESENYHFSHIKNGLHFLCCKLTFKLYVGLKHNIVVCILFFLYCQNFFFKKILYLKKSSIFFLSNTYTDNYLTIDYVTYIFIVFLNNFFN